MLFFLFFTILLRFFSMTERHSQTIHFFKWHYFVVLVAGKILSHINKYLLFNVSLPELLSIDFRLQKRVNEEGSEMSSLTSAS